MNNLFYLNNSISNNILVSHNIEKRDHCRCINLQKYGYG